jgi:ADP-dependent NAD(P)H-hydrate dehydratase
MSAPEEVSLETVGRFALPALAGTVDKGTRGHVMVVGGGGVVPGAVLLTGLGALRAGAGKLQLAAPGASVLALGLAVPEAAVLSVSATSDGELAPAAAADLAPRLKTTDAIVVGPGMMDPIGAGRLALGLMGAETTAAFLMDAAAMTGLDYADPRVRAVAGRLVLTPHAGEMAKLSGARREDVEDDPLGAARGIAQAAGAVVVMKGADTFIVSPDGRAWRHRGGVAGLATSGSGDVLAGIIGGLLARGASPLVASVWGVCVHGGAGARLSDSLGPLGFLARELLDEIPRVLASAVRASG